MDAALPSLAIIVVARNEERRIVAILRHLRSLAPEAAFFVADGGSTDGTARLAASLAQVVAGADTLGGSQNRAAAHATADVLLFVHADTHLADITIVRETMRDPAVVGGAYRLRFDDRAWVYGQMARRADARSLRGEYTGDQAVFVRRAVFERMGGFPEWPLMEDVAFSERLRHEGRVVLLDADAVTSTRRHKAVGPYRLIARVFAIRTLYRLGASKETLVRFWRRGGTVVPDRAAPASAVMPKPDEAMP